MGHVLDTTSRKVFNLKRREFFLDKRSLPSKRERYFYLEMKVLLGKQGQVFLLGEDRCLKKWKVLFEKASPIRIPGFDWERRALLCKEEGVTLQVFDDFLSPRAEAEERGEDM